MIWLKAIAGATLTHKGVTIALTDFAASDLTAKATVINTTPSASVIRYKTSEFIDSIANYAAAYVGGTLTTALTLADFQDSDTPKDGPDGAGITSVSWDYTKDASHLGVTDKADFDFDGWDGTNPANRFKANALEITFTWNGIRQTVTYADLVANKVFRLPSDFDKKSVISYNLYGESKTASLADIVAGDKIDLLPSNFAKKAMVSFTFLGESKTASLADIVAGDKIDLLPSNFAKKAMVSFTFLGETRTASLADIIAGNKIDLLPSNFAKKAMVSFTFLGETHTASLADIIAGNKVDLLPRDFLQEAEASVRQFADDALQSAKLSAFEAGQVIYNPDAVSKAEGRAVLDAAVGAPTIGLITVPDGAVYQAYDLATDSWVTVTDDAAPDRPGQQVEVDLANFVTGQARFVEVDDEGTPVALQPSDAFVTVKVRVFDGTELSSVERDIRVHVKAVNDAPTAGEAAAEAGQQSLPVGRDVLAGADYVTGLITRTLPDNEIWQRWDGLFWADLADRDTTLDGVQVRFSLDDVKAGLIRWVSKDPHEDVVLGLENVFPVSPQSRNIKINHTETTAGLVWERYNVIKDKWSALPDRDKDTVRNTDQIHPWSAS